MNKIKFIIIFLSIQTSIFAQEVDDTYKLDSSQNEFMFYGAFNLNVVQAELSDRFRNFFGMGGGIMYKTKSEWYFGAEFQYMFNDKVRDPSSVLSSILSSDNTITGADGFAANVLVAQQGWHLQFLKVGKQLIKLPVLSANQSSGIIGMVGLGVLQHEYRIVDRGNTAPQLSKEYVKGYDNLRNGLSVSPFLGYVYFDRSRFINFIIGAEYIMAFTESRRDFNFNSRQKDTSTNFDQMIALKLIWNIPVRKKLSRDFYYF